MIGIQKHGIEMISPKVSVIIPVYNTEAYIDEAIRSVLAQTLTDWELILVNDGSTDNSLSILRAYAQSDARIVLIDQANAGLSATRNQAVARATGDYIYFLDSDDKIEVDTLDKCFANCVAHDLDFVFFDASTIADDPLYEQTHTQQYVRKHTVPYVIGEGVVTLKALLNRNEYLVSACLVFTKRNYILKHNLSFKEGLIHEDELYTTQLFLLAQRVMYIPSQFFIRRLRANSIMTSTIGQRNIDSYFYVAEQMKAIALATPSYEEVIDLYLTKLLNALLWKAHTMPLAQRLKLCCRSMAWSSYIQYRSWMVLLIRKYMPKK